MLEKDFSAWHEPPSSFPRKKENLNLFFFSLPRYGKPSPPERVSKKKQALLDTEKGPSLILEPRIAL